MLQRLSPCLTVLAQDEMCVRSHICHKTYCGALCRSLDLILPCLNEKQILQVCKW